MATYTSSVGTFVWDIELPSDAWVELFSSKKYVTSTPIPFAFAAGSSEVVQYLSVGNPKSKFTIQATDDSTHAQLESLWQQQQTGTLDLTREFGPGFVFANVVLSDVGKKMRRPWQAAWKIEVEFQQFT
jgi:hypothetical protein